MIDYLAEAVALARKAENDYTTKQEWLIQGRDVLLILASDMDLPEASYVIRTNPGGPAVAGECILHHDRFYVCLGTTFIADAGYARTCNGRTDYTGGRNRIIPANYDGLLALCKGLRAEGRVGGVV